MNCITGHQLCTHSTRYSESAGLLSRPRRKNWFRLKSRRIGDREETFQITEDRKDIHLYDRHKCGWRRKVYPLKRKSLQKGMSHQFELDLSDAKHTIKSVMRIWMQGSSHFEPECQYFSTSTREYRVLLCLTVRYEWRHDIDTRRVRAPLVGHITTNCVINKLSEAVICVLI